MRAFISNTGIDLADDRAGITETCMRFGIFPIAMEFFESMGLGATAGSKHKLDEADVYVGIFAHRYSVAAAQGAFLSIFRLTMPSCTIRCQPGPTPIWVPHAAPPPFRPRVMKSIRLTGCQ